MSLHGWQINLSGASIPVYGGDNDNWLQQGSYIGEITNNECFAEGSSYGYSSGWQGWGHPVHFINASHIMSYGAINGEGTVVDFEDYASNGTSWVAVDTLERAVVYETRAYYADGSGNIVLPAGSRVWLDSGCACGQTHPNYIAVTAVKPANGSKIEFDGNGFVDLIYGGRWVNVGSILLRKA